MQLNSKRYEIHEPCKKSISTASFRLRERKGLRVFCPVQILMVFRDRISVLRAEDLAGFAWIMRLFSYWVLIILLGFLAPRATAAAKFTRGIVATVHPLATEAGLNVLKNGGNAIDATVAVALTLGVVDGENSGIGGGCFMLIRRANGDLVAIDGRETAPAAATREMFIRNGEARTELSQTGALARNCLVLSRRFR